MHPSKEEFFKFIFYDNERRIIGKRNLSKDELQWDKNLSLLSEERALEEKYLDPNSYNLYFIVGAPRTGSTMLSQILIKAFKLGCQYNGVAKYYMAPLFGYHQLKRDSEEKQELSSFLGNTKGDLNAHEFGYFWQYWLNFKEHHEPSEADLSRVDIGGLQRKLLTISNYLQNDLLVKNQVYFNFIISWVKQHFQNAKFIYIHRKESDVVSSILEARIQQYGNYEDWWSSRPKLFKSWQKKSSLEQVTHQVLYTNHLIQQQLKGLTSTEFIDIDYDELIKNTETTLKRLEVFFHRAPVEVEQIIRGIRPRKKEHTLPWDKEIIETTINSLIREYNS